MAGPLSGAEVLITAGPTHEYLDDVRYLGNPSTARMGIELAQLARELGANVTIVMGPTHLMPPPGVSAINVVSAIEMMGAVGERFGDCDVFIASAAVSDYRPRERARGKLKKGAETMTLELVSNPDVLKTVTLKRRDGQVIVGFSLESDNPLRNGRKKLEDKHCDLMVVNTPANFGESVGEVRVLNKQGIVREIPPKGKREIAEAVLTFVARLRREESLEIVTPFEGSGP